jgi:hypothetical protein
MFSSYIVPAFADNGNSSHEIDRIVTTGNTKIIYYKNGGKELFFTNVETMKSSDTEPSNNNASNEVDKIVTTNNGTTIYYKNGAKEVTYVFSSTSRASSSTFFSFEIAPTLMPIFPFDILSEIIQEIIEGIFSPLGTAVTILALQVLHIIRNLRHNRPRDYNGVICERT